MAAPRHGMAVHPEDHAWLTGILNAVKAAQALSGPPPRTAKQIMSLKDRGHPGSQLGHAFHAVEQKAKLLVTPTKADKQVRDLTPRKNPSVGRSLEQMFVDPVTGVAGSIAHGRVP